MQQRNFRQRPHSSRSFKASKRRVSSFNPTFFINTPQQQTVQEDYITKNTFADFLIADQIKRNIVAKGYEKPTPIQDQVIPEALLGKDVIGLANTGTGKTGAFLIPLINKVFFNRAQKILIIAPTRELALQIQEEAQSLARNMNIFTVLTIGGSSIHNQFSAIRRNPHFVIGTPGRLKDLVQNGKLNLSGFSNIVLDEVDRMMDMGFINDIKFLISKLPSQRQSLFFSATLPNQLLPLVHMFLKNPVKISVKSQDSAEAVKQDVVKVSGKDKIDVLESLLRQPEFSKVLVFGRTKWGIEKLSKILIQKGFKAAAIHGNKNQNQRIRALDAFKKNVIQVLLATDVASRGLDIDSVTHVINYDLPESYEDYIHRIGRTGRADKKGIALTFVD